MVKLRIREKDPEGAGYTYAFVQYEDRCVAEAAATALNRTYLVRHIIDEAT